MANGLVVKETGLVVSNPLVKKMAKRLRWSPERAIVRIQRALPSPLEQQVYLELASDFGILPESMAKLLRFYLGEEELQIDDLDHRVVGDNLVSSKFVSFSEFLRECLNLLKIVSNEYTSFSLGIEQAAIIVTHYGTDQPELLIEMVDGSLEELCDMLGVSNNRPYSHRMRLCIWLMVTNVIPENRKAGRPDVLDLTDILSVSASRRIAMRRAVLEDMNDLLSGDADEWRTNPTLRALRRDGTI